VKLLNLNTSNSMEKITRGILYNLSYRAIMDENWADVDPGLISSTRFQHNISYLTIQASSYILCLISTSVEFGLKCVAEWPRIRCVLVNL